VPAIAPIAMSLSLCMGYCIGRRVAPRHFTLSASTAALYLFRIGHAEARYFRSIKVRQRDRWMVESQLGSAGVILGKSRLTKN